MFANVLYFVYYVFVKKVIYLDNSATTPVKSEVILSMKPYWNELFGNPGSITKIGAEAKRVLEDSRKKIADILKVRKTEIIFTSGGTESNNLAIFGLVNSLEKKGQKISDMHFITTAIEHSSILECFKELERRGAKLSYLKVNEKGIVNPCDLKKLITSKTVLVSVGYANNEIGIIQPIKELAKEIRYAHKIHQNKNLINYPLFHTDASQAGLYCNLNLNELGVDLLTLDAQKIYGPKGIGILFRKNNIDISPLIFGGGQESGLRSGTENIPLIVGLTKALEIARKNFQLKSEKIKIIRDYFWQKIQKEIPQAILNGDLEKRLPNNLNISILNIDTEFVVFALDEQGIICSTKSACLSNEEGSLVIRNLYQEKLEKSEFELRARSTLRFSLGENITKKDIDYTVKQLTKIIKKIPIFI